MTERESVVSLPNGQSTGPSERDLAIIIALLYVNTTSTTECLFGHVGNRTNALNVDGSLRIESTKTEAYRLTR